VAEKNKIVLEPEQIIMRKVYIGGIGQIPVREHWDYSLRELAARAVLLAMDDAQIENVDALYVGNMLSGILTGQENLGTLIAEYAGLDGIEAIKVEAACASGSAALRQAVLAVSSGMLETAVVVGVEKLTELSGFQTTAALATAADADYEAAMGLSFCAINALLMRRYMHEYNYIHADFAEFVVIAHRNAVHNPNAMFHFEITQNQYSKSKMIADPITLLDSSPIADGAAAVVITSNEKSIMPEKSVFIASCELGTDTIAVHNRSNPLWLKGVEKSTFQALKTAGVGHQDIDAFEGHDAFSIMIALSLEASGFFEKGQAVTMANNGKFELNGNLPISVFGGLKGRGHPVGATGIYQIVESAIQLRGEAPNALKLEDVKRIMTQNIGGSGSNVTTTILEKASF
jgi:acetyl-CoA C-acetyltransferase